ncbi:MAG: hypothetical protein HQK93_05245, partial [Nitrospirae bacterium]|nr:hypothetical protein [Nitrospirota bacterium]
QQKLKEIYKLIQVVLDDGCYTVAYVPEDLLDKAKADLQEYFGRGDFSGDFLPGYNLVQIYDGGDYRDTFYVSSLADKISSYEGYLFTLKNVLKI